MILRLAIGVGASLSLVAMTAALAAAPAAVGTALVGPPVSEILGDPVPGIDVSLEQIPQGRIVATTQTDTLGRYQFQPTRPGAYCVRTAPVSISTAQRGKNWNSSRSNVSRLGVSVGATPQPIATQDLSATPAPISNCFSISGRAAQAVSGVLVISIKEEGVN